MTVPLTDGQYGALLHGLRRIASGRKINQCGNNQRMCRDDLVTEAREICDAVGIKWDMPIDTEAKQP